MSKQLFIAEKPDMGANIAKNLPGPHKRGDGYIVTGGGIVTWAIGHILEQCPPEVYDEKYKKWNFADLPIIPGQWKMQPSASKRKQLNVIKNLLKQCTEIVNAGDPGREGQLIVDEILYFLGNKKPVKRLLLNSLDAKSVQKALSNMEDNDKYKNLYDAAIGRQRADWTVGMNLTRAYTILGRDSGYSGVLSVGRVQTPTLAIVVRREEEIENFVPKKYFTLFCQIGSTPQFRAKYLPPVQYRKEGEERPKWLDDSFRVCDEAYAKKIIQDVSGGVQATVVEYTNKPAKEAPPMPFELSDIQSRMNAKVGASVQQTLEACQSLYEKGYASYPRTDCAYLPPNQHSEAGQVFNSISQAMPDISSLVAKADASLMSRAWNEKKLGEHHAIIPTTVAPDFDKLTQLEKSVYEAISLRYLAQFFPDCEVDKANVELEAGGHRWGAKGRVIKVAGWREVYGTQSEDEDDSEGGADENETQDENATLPSLATGEKHPVVDSKMEQKFTKPPSRYTEGTLLQAMKFVDKLVSDPDEKKMLKNVQGIGRAATRPGIINTLIKRQFLLAKKKQLHPSDAAKELIKAVNKDLTDPGLTARWEQVLDGVALGKIPLQAFTQKQEQWVKHLVSKISGTKLSLPAGGGSGGKGGFKKKPPAKITDKKCSKCGKPMAERVVGKGPKKGTKFLGCTGFPECKNSEWPK